MGAFNLINMSTAAWEDPDGIYAIDNFFKTLFGSIWQKETHEEHNFAKPLTGIPELDWRTNKRVREGLAHKIRDTEQEFVGLAIKMEKMIPLIERNPLEKLGFSHKFLPIENCFTRLCNAVAEAGPYLAPCENQKHAEILAEYTARYKKLQSYTC